MKFFDRQSDIVVSTDNFEEAVSKKEFFAEKSGTTKIKIYGQDGGVQFYLFADVELPLESDLDQLIALLNFWTTVPNQRSTQRYTVDHTILLTEKTLFGDTDGGSINFSLPAGQNALDYRISNAGTSGNDLTLIPNGTDKLVGNNESFAIMDGETLDLIYEPTEGWTA